MLPAEQTSNEGREDGGNYLVQGRQTSHHQLLVMVCNWKKHTQSDSTIDIEGQKDFRKTTLYVTSWSTLNE